MNYSTRDYLKPSPKEIKRVLASDQAPSTDAEYKEAIRKLYAEPGLAHKSLNEVNKLLQKHADNLSSAFMTALYAVRGRSRKYV